MLWLLIKNECLNKYKRQDVFKLPESLYSTPYRNSTCYVCLLRTQLVSGYTKLKKTRRRRQPGCCSITRVEDRRAVALTCRRQPGCSAKPSVGDSQAVALYRNLCQRPPCCGATYNLCRRQLECGAIYRAGDSQALALKIVQETARIQLFISCR